MKKTYVIPEMITTEMVVEQLLANSPGVNSDGNVVTPTNPEPGNGDDAAIKRNYDVWDDDWSR